MLDFTNLHVGTTSRCTLLCPECTRNMSGSKYITDLRDLDTDFFTKFLSDISIKHILFCGNWGDPIYTKGFLEMLTSIKNANPNCSVTIHTNGAYKATAWWKRLMGVLQDNDRLIFSIDGTPENYSNYRRNTDWSSVKTAIETAVDTKQKTCKATSVEWKYIVFSYNEHTILDAYKLSKEYGFDNFFLQEALISETPDLTPSRSFEEIQKEFYEQIS